jgi:hypothetical protein
MNRRIPTVAVAAGLLAAAAPVAELTTGGAAIASPASVSSLHFIERGGAVRFIDSAPPRARGPFDFSPGDQAIVTRILQRPGAGRVGSLILACTAITATTQHCAGTLRLAGGTLEVAGISSPLPTTNIVLTGGTGAYAGDTGTGEAKDRPGRGDSADLTLTLNTR